MQIDFHHTVTYVTARLAGFAHPEADIIAYSAQYVDDAITNGAIHFDNRAMYLRTSSAHKTLDTDNLLDTENHLVWLPFHFLPGNNMQPADAGLTACGGKFINKIVCRPDSPVAREMVDAAIAYQGHANSLHRLGVTMHVYADTWAHQGFAGVLHEINEVNNAQEIDQSGVFDNGGLQGFLANIFHRAIPALGHGQANIFPDMPFLSWNYRDGINNTIVRNNADLFCEAADGMCRAMQRYRQVSDPTVPVTGIGTGEMTKIRNLFTDLTTKDEAERHGEWISAIADGTFFTDNPTVSYAGEGPNSWKGKALGISSNDTDYHYNDQFLNSDWKYFHDAIQLHRLTVLHDILPKYGICAG